MACDGKNSKIARDVGIPLTSKDYKQQALVTSVKHERNHKGIAYQFFMPTGPLAILPLRKNRSSIVWVLPTKIGLCHSCWSYPRKSTRKIWTQRHDQKHLFDMSRDIVS